MNTKRLTVQRALWTAQGEPIPVGEAAVAVAFGTCQSPNGSAWSGRCKYAVLRSVLLAGGSSPCTQARAPWPPATEPGPQLPPQVH